GMGAAEKRRSGARMVRGGRTAAIGLRVTHIADDADLVTKRFQRLKNFRKFEVRPLAFGRPFVHCGAVREVNGAESRLRDGTGLLQRRRRRNHRFEKGQCDRYTSALQESAS